MKLIFLGPPGAGKGTQAKLFASHQHVAHVSTGEMLRQAVAEGSELGKQVKGIMESGQLVSDDLIVSIIAQRIKKADCSSGYILDGFPRTVEQAKALEEMLAADGDKIDRAVYFSISDQELLKRLAHRRASEGRADDSDEVQRDRLKVYQEQTAPLIKYYKDLGKLLEVDADDTVEEVQTKLTELLV